MIYKKTAIDNGLRVIAHPMKQRHSVAIGLMVGVGARYEEKRIKGAAHFLEHMAFKGSRSYSCDKIKEEIEGVGGSLNAFTSEEQTCYFAKVPSNHLEKSFDVLSDMVFFPKLSAGDFAKEKGVILEEIKMYHDLPQYYVADLLEALMWGKDHPLGQELAGSIETVSAMTIQDLRRFHQQRYFPNNIVVSVSGAIDYDQVVKLVKDKLQSVNLSGSHDFLKMESIQQQPRFIAGFRKIEQMHLILGMPGYKEDHKDRYKLSILAIILGGNMSSRLFNEVREKRGLAYSISTSAKYMHDIGAFAIRAGVDNKKLGEAVEVILKELDRIRKKEVSQDEFIRAKDYLLGQLLISLEDTMDHMLWMAESVLERGYVKQIKQIIEEFEKISIEDILQVAKDVLDEKKYNLAVVGPIKDDQKKELSRLLKI